MGRVWNPISIMVLLHYYCSAEPYREAPAIHDAIELFIREGLMEMSDGPSGYEVTGRGRALVELLLQTPIPVSAWVDPRDGEVVVS